jgi:hypothetical protein
VPLLPRLNIQSKLIVLLLLVCISSIIAIAAIGYSTGKDALTQAIFNHLTSVRATKRSEIESQFQLIRSQIINLSSDPSVVECMLGLRANFAAFTDSEVRPGWDEKLLTYYRDDFLPKLAQNTKLVDFMRLDSALGKPVALIGAPIFDGPNQIGVIAIQLPTDEINRVMTGNFGWEQEGLGKTGEAFLVGSDFLMRSRSRLLWQDKKRYFEELEKAGYSKADIDQVRRAGTALLAQYVHMPAVEKALGAKRALTSKPTTAAS